MIPKIRRGQRMTGLLVYLLGKGDHNEHRDRHIIAGSPTIMRSVLLEHFDGTSKEVTEAARKLALEVAHEIDIPRQLYGTQVRMRARSVAVGVGARELGMDVVEPASKGEASVMRDAPVWHCVLALTPGEELDDAKWEQIANDFMDRMGFTGSPDGKRAQARWAAVRHGHSGEQGEGQDHIHIAASLVREDGSKVSTFDYGPGRAKGDWKRAQEVAGELEHEYGLQVLVSREQGGGLSGNSRAEIERAKATGAPETERERLRRMVRAVATAADSETEFVESLREAGISAAPRWAAGGREQVTGYKVRMRRAGEEVGPWVGGGTLAGDLSLTALREQQWDDTPAGRADAAAAWKHSRPGQARDGRSQQGRGGVEAWRQAAADAGQWRARMAEVPHTDRAQWAWAAGQAAGVFAAWSESLEGDRPGPFARAAHELTRSAQPLRRTDRYRIQRGQRSLGAAARVLLASRSRPATGGQARPGASDPAGEIAAAILAAMLLLLLLAIAIALEIARAHRSRGELARAVALEYSLQHHVDPVRAAWEASLESRRYQWDRDAADVVAAAAGHTAQRVAEQETSPAETPRPASTTARDTVVAAASGPLTAPTAPSSAPKRRPYYSELSAEDKARVRTIAVANAGFARYDIAPRSWSDEKLEAELRELRTEVDLLTRDIDDRRTHGGPHARQAAADNADLTGRAEKIPAAQKARRAAADLARRERQLTEQRDRLAQQLEQTPRRRMLARQKLTDQIGETTGQLGDIAPQLAIARKAEKAATTAAAIPAEDWDDTLREASEDRRQRRLAAAQDTDRRELADDTTHLGRLTRDLAKVEAEHTHRATLTPAQRAARQRSGGKAQPGPTTSTARGTTPPRDPSRGSPQPGRGPERGGGPER
ncbi:relaxase/mobilization nuclease domain-containing protein [Nocardia sp. NPDC051570]|uniref:relaxase/mobilization nuclease domain-containing protein n=1 Tax=Nocardia sp. NPDC051570 TaxID=3364324 RepID=UPI00378DD5FA